MTMIQDVPVCGNPVDQGAVEQILRSRAGVERAALMADHHKGYGVPIGGVVASQELIGVSAVGYDIGCGNKAILTDADANDVRANIKTIMDDIVRKISFGVGRTSGWDLDDPLFDSPLWNEVWVLKQKNQELKKLAQKQLGTVGSGNHYVDIFVDEKDRVWVGVHFGSRGLGHKIATTFLEVSGASQEMDAEPVNLHMRSDLGETYIKCMELAGQYAYAGRNAVCAKVAEILGAKVMDSVHNHHNFAWRENHDGIDYWVARKGATPAFPGQKGFVGGSMGDNAVILEGIDSAESKLLLRSTVHGAGRIMSRTAASGKNKWGKVKGPGAILRTDMDKWVKDFGVELRGADVDEAPQAYKRLHEVIPAQGNTIRILHTLKPIGVAMAGDEYDPYKD